jgi:hypothetical protein
MPSVCIHSTLHSKSVLQQSGPVSINGKWEYNDNEVEGAGSQVARSFLKTGATAAAAGAAVLAMPNVARAQEAAVFKFQSTWPAKDIFHEYAKGFVNRVNEMGGGRLKIELAGGGCRCQGARSA